MRKIRLSILTKDGVQILIPKYAFDNIFDVYAELLRITNIVNEPFNISLNEFFEYYRNSMPITLSSGKVIKVYIA